MNAIEQLATNGTGVSGILASLVVVEFAVIVYQWKYTKDHTIPKEMFYKQEEKFDGLAKVVTDGLKTIGENIVRLTTMIDERLKKK